MYVLFYGYLHVMQYFTAIIVRVTCSNVLPFHKDLGETNQVRLSVRWLYIATGVLISEIHKKKNSK